MTDPDTHAAAVQIAAEEFDAYHYDNVENAEHVVAALARRYAFVEHAELAALRAVVDAMTEIRDDLIGGGTGLFDGVAARITAALDALPPATPAPAVPPGDVEPPRGCNREIWPIWANHWVSCGSVVRANGKCAKYGHEQLDAVPAGPQPAATGGARAGGEVSRLRAAVENVLAHTGGEQDGYVLVQAEYVESLRRCVRESWGFDATPADRQLASETEGCAYHAIFVNGCTRCAEHAEKQ